MNPKDDPAEKHFFQTERFFSANQQWYFSTRETVDQGPFSSRPIAEHEFNMFLKIQIGIGSDYWDTPGASR